jgi:cysteine synthase A
MNIAENVTELVGRTPLLKLNRISEGLSGTIVAKLESFNPCSSVKDRPALNMIETAEKECRIQKGSVLIEPTSGNTGVGLAFVAAAKGYRLILTMPDTMTIERRKLFRLFGAELVLTDGKEGMKGAIAKAEELQSEIKNSVILQQFQNPANPKAHEMTTGPEIWHDSNGRVDCLVAGVGTGGTITGVSRFVKSKKPEFKAIAVEPQDSPVISGGEPGPHKIPGIGAGFVPDNLDKSLLDEVIQVSNEDAESMVYEVAQKEGLMIGISAGANIWAAREVARRKEFDGKLIVTIICDTGERYLSTLSLQGSDEE